MEQHSFKLKFLQKPQIGFFKKLSTRVEVFTKTYLRFLSKLILWNSLQVKITSPIV